MPAFITPVFLLFVIVISGCLLGKIKVFGISLDLSAVLIVAVAMGACIEKLVPQLFDATLESNLNLFSKLGTALFVSAIGLSAGSSVSKDKNRNNFLCFVIGALMVIVGIVFMNVIGSFDEKIDTSLLKGILCGAMTSTPGLSSACESEGVISELAVLGYGCSYLFGVVGVVLFVQCMTRKEKCDAERLLKSDKAKIKSIAPESLIFIALSAVLGSMLGSLKIPFIDFSFGTSGGILCVSVFIGSILRRSFGGISSEQLSCYRSFGLVMFFVGSGVPAGIGLSSAFDLKWFIYGVILTLIPMMAGYILSTVVLKKQKWEAMCVVAGGMTSTPAMGVLLRNSNIQLDLHQYYFTYVGALMTMTLGIRL